MKWQLAKWWALVNTAGALITVAAVEMNYSWHVERHDFRPHPPGYAISLLAQLLALTALGLLQVAVCFPLIALNHSRRRGFQIATGVALGVVTAFFIPIVGALFIYVLAVAAFFTLFPSGIVFGTIAGLWRWRSLNAR